MAVGSWRRFLSVLMDGGQTLYNGLTCTVIYVLDGCEVSNASLQLMGDVVEGYNISKSIRGGKNNSAVLTI